MLLKVSKSKFIVFSFFLCGVLQLVRPIGHSTRSMCENCLTIQVSSFCQERYLCLFYLDWYMEPGSSSKKKNCTSNNCRPGGPLGDLVSQTCNGYFELLEVIYPGRPKCAFCFHSLLWPPSLPSVTWSHPSLAWIPHCLSVSTASPPLAGAHRKWLLLNTRPSSHSLDLPQIVHPTGILFIFLSASWNPTHFKDQVKYTCSSLLSWIFLPFFHSSHPLHTLYLFSLSASLSLHQILMIVLIVLALSFQYEAHQKICKRSSH